MSSKEKANWDKSAVFGFYVYMLLLFIDQSYYLIIERSLISTYLIFWAGLILTFGHHFILNLKTNLFDK
ncbi:hypothetical protein [Aquibacillus kalidii]|uniref:hypothetical protein n=1 Tax=Aquibacillus kalidii TaxID=2762597 RepID=UPI001F451E7A|nr:hypothetical protein [Aquibacillus kalidii]